MPVNQVGTTTSSVNLRVGPGTNFKAITMLPNRTSVNILAETNGWLKVSVNNQSGFILKDFVILPSQKIGSGFFIQQASLKNIPLAPARLFGTPSDADPKTKQLIKIWNKFGGSLQRLSDLLMIEVGAAASVVAVESSGNGFLNERLIIRFENHYFWRLWGKDNPDKFQKYFSFAENQPWTNHQFRPDPTQPWQNFHGNQDSEWAAFNKAKSLNDEAAKSAISMGLPQIMGANFKLIGYESASEMFNSFSLDERRQIIGLFDFIQGPETVSRKVIALQNQDFVAFAEQYNGPGQAAQYGGMLRFHFELFKLLK